MITHQDRQPLAQQFADALTNHDIAAFDTFIADDYVNHNRYIAPGRTGVKQFFAEWPVAFPDTLVTLDQAFVDGTTVIGQYTYRGTHQGTIFGIAPTRNTIEMHSIDIWRTHAGRFSEHWDELNLLEVFQQLGVIPPIM